MAVDYQVIVRQRVGDPAPDWFAVMTPIQGTDPAVVQIPDAKVLQSLSGQMERELTKASMSQFPVEVHDPDKLWLARLWPGGDLQASPTTGYFSPWVQVVDAITWETVFFGYLDGASLEHDVPTATTSFSVTPATELLRKRVIGDYPEFLRPDPEIVDTTAPVVSFTAATQDTIGNTQYSSTAGFESIEGVLTQTPMHQTPYETGAAAAIAIRADHLTRFAGHLAAGRIPWKLAEYRRWGYYERTGNEKPNQAPTIIAVNFDTTTMPEMPSNVVKIGANYYPVHVEMIPTFDPVFQYESREYIETTHQWYDADNTPNDYLMTAETFVAWSVAMLVLDTAVDLTGIVTAGATIEFASPTVVKPYYLVVAGVTGPKEAPDPVYEGDKFLNLNTVDQLTIGDRLKVNWLDTDGRPQSKEITVTGIIGSLNRVLFSEPFSGSDIPQASFTGVVRLDFAPVQVAAREYLEKVCAPFTFDWSQYERPQLPAPALSWLPYGLCSATPLFGAFRVQGIPGGVHVARRGPRDVAETTGAAGAWTGTLNSLQWQGGSDLRTVMGTYANYASWKHARTVPAAPLKLYTECDAIGGHRINSMGTQPWRSRRRVPYYVMWGATNDPQMEPLDITTVSASTIDWAQASPANRTAWVLFSPASGRIWKWGPTGTTEFIQHVADGSLEYDLPPFPNWTGARLAGVGLAPGGLMEVHYDAGATSGVLTHISDTTDASLPTRGASVTLSNDSLGKFVRWDCGGGLLAQVCLDRPYGRLTYSQRTRLHYYDGTNHYQLDIPRVEVVAHTICPVGWSGSNPTRWAMLALEDYAPDGNQNTPSARVRYILVNLEGTTLRVANGEIEPDPVYPRDREFDFRRGDVVIDGLNGDTLEIGMVRVDQSDTLAGVLNGRPFQVSATIADFIEWVDPSMTAYDLLEAYCGASLAAAVPTPEGGFGVVSKQAGTFRAEQAGTEWASFPAELVKDERITAMATEFLGRVTVSYMDPVSRETRELVVKSGFLGGTDASLDLSKTVASPVVAAAVGRVVVGMYGVPRQTRTFSLHSPSTDDAPFWSTWVVGDRLLRFPSAGPTAPAWKLTKLGWAMGDALVDVELQRLPTEVTLSGDN